MGRFVALVLTLLMCSKVAASAGTLQIVGQARLDFLFWPIYESRLYSADGAYEEGQLPLRLEIQYQREVDAEDLVKHTQSEWRGQGLSNTSEQRWLATLSQLFPDVRANDVLTLLVDEQGRSVFFINGQALGQIDDPQFGRQFLAIWLSPNTSRPDLREDLLSLN